MDVLLPAHGAVLVDLHQRPGEVDLHGVGLGALHVPRVGAGDLIRHQPVRVVVAVDHHRAVLHGAAGEENALGPVAAQKHSGVHRQLQAVNAHPVGILIPPGGGSVVDGARVVESALIPGYVPGDGGVPHLTDPSLCRLLVHGVGGAVLPLFNNAVHRRLSVGDRDDKLRLGRGRERHADNRGQKAGQQDSRRSESDPRILFHTVKAPFFPVKGEVFRHYSTEPEKSQAVSPFPAGFGRNFPKIP